MIYLVPIFLDIMVFLGTSNITKRKQNKVLDILWHLVANLCVKLNFHFSPYSGKFHLLVQDDHDKSKSHKLKYYAKECKSKVMFDVSSSHHQHSNQMRLNAKMVSKKKLNFVIGKKVMENFPSLGENVVEIFCNVMKYEGNFSLLCRGGGA